MSIRSRQTMKKSNNWIFLKINKNHFLSLVFNQPHCRGNSSSPSQNARINASVVNFDSCKKRAPKHKIIVKRNGELGIGTWKLCLATLTLTVPLSTQEYKWVPVNCWRNLTNCRGVTCSGLTSSPVV